MPTKNDLTEQRKQRALVYSKNPEPLNGLANYMRGLPFLHPERVAYLNVTKPGTKAGTAPRTINELQRLAAGKPSLRRK